MEFRRRSVSFPSASTVGPVTSNFTEVFPRAVVSAVAGLAGFASGYDDQDDRPFGELQVNIETSINGDSVEVVVSYGLRDWSGQFDDAYLGLIDVVLFVELEGASPAAEREDLQITGIEFNQATQTFRSALHLPAAQVQPDNSIPLVAGKPTGVRVYTDYDPNSGLPAITSLSGELEVRTPTQTVTIAPIEDITPIRDTQINRGIFEHTLNFVVDEQFCQGDVDFRVNVFDAADPTQISSVSQQTRSFINLAPIRMFIVGINYTFDSNNIPAPTLADVLPFLSFMERTYPTPSVDTVGYAVLQDFDKDVVDGNGLDEANKLIRDLKGDSEDVYFGAFPPGVTFGEFTGQQTRGVSSGALDQVLIAHEVGHAFGRLHAPCAVPSACDNPADLDDSYPQYNSYARHSIGEFGFDPLESNTANTVKSPADRFDFMSYAFINRWISPYTYVALMDPGSPVSGAGVAAASVNPQGRGVWDPKKRMILFLDMKIDQLCRVERRTSFHFPAFAFERRGDLSPFRAEFWDECHRVLSCHKLYVDPANCTKDCCCYEFYAKLRYPEGARWLVIYDGKEKIYEECIPDPPRVSIKCDYDPRKDAVSVDWSAEGHGIDDDDIWYIVQWQDFDGTWRGLMPRTQEHAAVVPTELIGRRRQMSIRVLASSGIATGLGECTVDIHRDRPVPAASVAVTRTEAGAAIAYVTDTAGHSLPDPGFVWFDQDGREIGRGRRLGARAARAVESFSAVATNYQGRTGRARQRPPRLTDAPAKSPETDYRQQ